MSDVLKRASAVCSIEGDQEAADAVLAAISEIERLQKMLAVYQGIASETWEKTAETERLRAARDGERAICAKIADDVAARYMQGGPASSLAEDNWGSVGAAAVAKAIRESLLP